MHLIGLRLGTPSKKNRLGEFYLCCHDEFVALTLLCFLIARKKQSLRCQLFPLQASLQQILIHLNTKPLINVSG